MSVSQFESFFTAQVDTCVIGAQDQGMKTALFTNISVLVTTLLSFSNFAFAEEGHRAMQEMHGGCDHFKMDVKSALKAWNEPTPAMAESVNETLPLSKKLALELKKQSEIRFAAAPGKTFGDVSKSYAGVFKFKTGADSKIQVASGAKVWFDVLEDSTQANLKAKEFEMQTACNTIFKVVAFELKPETAYTLQVSSSQKPEVSFLLNPIQK